MSRIDEMMLRQTERLDRLTEAEAHAVRVAFEQAREELERKLRQMILTGRDEATPWTAQRTRVALAVTREGLGELRDRLDRQLTLGIGRVREQSQVDLLEEIREFEPEFRLTGSDVDLERLRRVSAPQGLALHRHSLDRYTRDTIQQVQKRLSVSLAKGEGLREAIEEVAGVDGVVERYGRHRAELIARMETSRSYNEAHLEGVQDAARMLDDDGTPDPMMKRIVEIRDHRNHPASRIAHGLTARVDEPFRLPVAPVEREAIRMYRERHPTTTKTTVEVTGIVWRLQGDHWVGQVPPIHFNDRSRVLPWRESWADDRAGEHVPRSDLIPS